jgi:hypothetical protein
MNKSNIILTIFLVIIVIGYGMMFYLITNLKSKCPNDGSTRRLHDSRCIGSLTYGK